ncbi:MAG: hypothetical protein KF820_01680 [Candidatus Paracaedibacteraceae bacterium]|nr:hypothetical protein [Candidatus Paracaedibacteraceae bacterium]
MNYWFNKSIGVSLILIFSPWIACAYEFPEIEHPLYFKAMFEGREARILLTNHACPLDKLPEYVREDISRCTVGVSEISCSSQLDYERLMRKYFSLDNVSDLPWYSDLSSEDQTFLVRIIDAISEEDFSVIFQDCLMPFLKGASIPESRQEKFFAVFARTKPGLFAYIYSEYMLDRGDDDLQADAVLLTGVDATLRKRFSKNGSLYGLESTEERTNFDYFAKLSSGEALIYCKGKSDSENDDSMFLESIQQYDPDTVLVTADDYLRQIRLIYAQGHFLNVNVDAVDAIPLYQRNKLWLARILGYFQKNTDVGKFYFNEDNAKPSLEKILPDSGLPLFFFGWGHQVGLSGILTDLMQSQINLAVMRDGQFLAVNCPQDILNIASQGGMSSTTSPDGLPCTPQGQALGQP